MSYLRKSSVLSHVGLSKGGMILPYRGFIVRLQRLPSTKYALYNNDVNNCELISEKTDESPPGGLYHSGTNMANRCL